MRGTSPLDNAEGRDGAEEREPGPGDLSANTASQSHFTMILAMGMGSLTQHPTVEQAGETEVPGAGVQGCGAGSHHRSYHWPK